jgi:5-hydroxyisourate hydrolase-like protein (transthyretin family)
MINLSQRDTTTVKTRLKTIRLHLLDLENGRSAQQVNVLLEYSGPDGWSELALKSIDFSGEEKALLEQEHLAPGIYKISINLAATSLASPYPYLPVVFQVDDSQNDYKISIMISAHGYTVSLDC